MEARKRENIHDVTFLDADGEFILRDGKPVPLEENKFEIKKKPNKKLKQEDLDQLKNDEDEDDEDEIPPPNELLVVLVQGKDITSTSSLLKAKEESENNMDGESVQSSACNISCIMTCNDQVVRSKIIEMSSDPKFESESYKFLISNPRKFLTLYFEEHDINKGEDVIIGKCSIHLRSILNDDRLDTVSWFELKTTLLDDKNKNLSKNNVKKVSNQSQSIKSGFVLLGLRWRYNQELDKTLKLPKTVNSRGTTPKSSPSPSRSGGMFSSSKSKTKANQDSDEVVKHEPNQLNIKVVRNTIPPFSSQYCLFSLIPLKTFSIYIISVYIMIILLCIFFYCLVILDEGYGKEFAIVQGEVVEEEW